MADIFGDVSKLWRIKSLTISRKLSVSLLRESSLAAECAFRIRPPDSSVSLFCCCSVGKGSSPPAEGAPNFERETWSPSDTHGGGRGRAVEWNFHASDGGEGHGGFRYLLPTSWWLKLWHLELEGIDHRVLAGSLTWSEVLFLPAFFVSLVVILFWWLCEPPNMLITHTVCALDQPELISVAATNKSNRKRIMQKNFVL